MLIPPRYFMGKIMSKIDDYINGLDGKTDLDPLEIARDLSKLHKDEIEPVEAKVAELNTVIADKDQKLSEAKAETQKFKALNFDLSLQIPSDTRHIDNNNDEKPNGGVITTKDLFSEKVRRNNPFIRRS